MLDVEQGNLARASDPSKSFEPTSTSFLALEDPLFTSTIPSTRCLVSNCKHMLKKNYHKRCRLCPEHMKSEINWRGQIFRFCQKCAKIQPIAEFDGAKRSCRAGLERHNVRQKALRCLKPQAPLLPQDESPKNTLTAPEATKEEVSHPSESLESVDDGVEPAMYPIDAPVTSLPGSVVPTMPHQRPMHLTMHPTSHPVLTEEDVQFFLRNFESSTESSRTAHFAGTEIEPPPLPPLPARIENSIEQMLNEEYLWQPRLDIMYEFNAQDLTKLHPLNYPFRLPQ